MSRLVFYNAGPPSETPPGSASRDLAGFLRDYRPRVAGAVEVVGDRLEPFPGYWLVRDTSRPGRANVAAYVREDCDLRRTWWVDHTTRWSRTNPGATGKHAARSSLILGIGQAQVLVAHQVPLGTDNTHAGQLEIVQALHLVLAPWKRPRIQAAAPELSLAAMQRRPRILLWDDNAPPDTAGLGTDYLAPKVGGHRHGKHIDNALCRAVPATAFYVQHAGGTVLATDHPWGGLVLNVDKGAVAWR